MNFKSEFDPGDKIQIRSTKAKGYVVRVGTDRGSATITLPEVLGLYEISVPQFLLEERLDGIDKATGTVSEKLFRLIQPGDIVTTASGHTFIWKEGNSSLLLCSAEKVERKISTLSKQTVWKAKNTDAIY